MCCTRNSSKTSAPWSVLRTANLLQPHKSAAPPPFRWAPCWVNQMTKDCNRPPLTPQARRAALPRARS
eukprot:8737724-Pyramimonas_sp.AAC.1